MSKLILGVDAGNHTGNVVGPFGTDLFKTNICDWFERDVKETHGSDDMEFEIGGRKGYAGSIALYEDEFSGGAMYGDSKAHEDTKIRILLAIYRYIERYSPNTNRVSLVTGQPIARHQEDEKDKIRAMLLGKHDFVVNNKRVSIVIENVGVAPEGGGAFWCKPSNEDLRIVDVGSGTVNAATYKSNRYINNGSDTFNYGMETVNNKSDLKGIARAVIRSTTTLKWNNVDNLWIIGGAADKLAPHIKAHYVNAEVINPVIMVGHKSIMLTPQYANAVGFYELAKRAFS